MKQQDKNIQTLMSYGIDKVLAQKLVDKNLTVSKIKTSNQKDLIDLGFSKEEVKIIKENTKRQEISDEVFQKLVIETELHCCICQDIYNEDPVIIHHITEYSISQDNSYDNLIVLCLNCHGNVHTTRHISQQDYPKEKLYDLKKKFIEAIQGFRLGYRPAPTKGNNLNTSSFNEISEQFKLASVDLGDYKNQFGNEIHIEREETKQLWEWINSELPQNQSKIAVLAGNAGTGKSVILRDLYEKLQNENVFVLGIKADRLSIHSIDDLNKELHIDIHENIKSLSKENKKIVFLVDQIDALSQTLSSNRTPIHTYHRLINQLSKLPNVRVVISCRIYDLEYDAILQEYLNKQIFRVSNLKPEQVKDVFTALNYKDYDTMPDKFKEFLSIPLHLQIYCKIVPEKDLKNYTLNSLYDELWSKIIEKKEVPKEFKLHDFIYKLASEMYDRQEIIVDSRSFTKDYKDAIDYLESNQIINTTKNKIQFIHQSFFDYSFARSFISSGKKLSEDLKEKHQGLFVRSKVKQVFYYLREVDIDLYISELKTILLSDEYRFHIKLLIINDLGFLENPNPKERYFVKKHLMDDAEYSKLFSEAIYSEKWFNFFIQQPISKNAFIEKNEEWINISFSICRKMIRKTPENVVNYLKNLPDTFDNKNQFICNVLFSIAETEITSDVLDLFDKTKAAWDKFAYYHFLEKIILNYPQKVISELNSKLDAYIPDNSGYERNYIPDSEDSSRIYEKLYQRHGHLAILFFIEVIKKITLNPTLAYFLYEPLSKDHHHELHEQIFDFVLEYLDHRFERNLEKAKEFVLPLIESETDILLIIPLRYFIKYPQQFLTEIYTLFISPNIFIEHKNRLFDDQFKDLLNASYSYFNKEQKETINTLILNAIPESERTLQSKFDKNDIVHKAGINYFGWNKYTLLSQLSEKERSENHLLNKEYNELHRKFKDWNYKNEKPRGVVLSGIPAPFRDKVYKLISFEDLKKSFRKYNSKWEKEYRTRFVNIGLHMSNFQELVSKNPEKYIKFIEEISKDTSIELDYVAYGLQGLTKANYNPIETKRLFLNCIGYRKDDLEHNCPHFLIWVIDYFINNQIIDKEIIDFLCNIVRNYPDGSMLNNDPITDGINSTKGAAAYQLVSCYKTEFKNEIFSTLESIAEIAEVQTRGAILYRMALLNNLDEERNLDLFLKLMHDFNPLLLKIQFHNLHPLFDLIFFDFPKLIPFFEKAILVEEAHEPMSLFLLRAWLNGCEGSESLLNSILEISSIAQQKVIEQTLKATKCEGFRNKCFELLNRFLDSDDEKLAFVYERSLLQLSKITDLTMIESFIDRYIKSKVGKYRGNSFYYYLLKISVEMPKKCIDWALRFNENIQNDTQRGIRHKALNVVIGAYNQIKEFDKENDYIDKAMNTFDAMLKVPEYRNTMIEVLKEVDVK